MIEVLVKLIEDVELPDGAVCRVELRDVSLLDAPSITLASVEEPVGGARGEVVLRTEIGLPPKIDRLRTLNIWAHVSMNGNGLVQASDFITMQAYPVDDGPTSKSMVVELKPVR